MAEQLELRAYIYIDRMQPQYAAFVGSITQGDLPVEGMASLYVEMAHYLFIALGEVHPGLTFRDLGSTAGAQSARDLASVLPDRPEHLPGPA